MSNTDIEKGILKDKKVISKKIHEHRLKIAVLERKNSRLMAEFYKLENQIEQLQESLNDK